MLSVRLTDARESPDGWYRVTVETWIHGRCCYRASWSLSPRGDWAPTRLRVARWLALDRTIRRVLEGA